MILDALLLAGGVPGPDDPLDQFAHGRAKSMLDLAGRPMIQWVLDALGGADIVGKVVISGLGPEVYLACSKEIRYLGDRGGMLENVKAGLACLRGLRPGATHALILSCDIPSITAEMVEWRAELALEARADIDYAVVERRVMEARFPASRRTYVRLRDAEVCGADLNVLSIDLPVKEGFWRKVIAARKSPFRQAALLGFDTLFLIAMRRLTLAGAESLVSRRIGLKGKVHISPYAEIAMDVDKPLQLEILRQDLAMRGSPNQ
jgi:molybdopterin-guanine dinucleotide biosynthesis protein A